MIIDKPKKSRNLFKTWQSQTQRQMRYLATSHFASKPNLTTSLILISTTLAIGIIGITSYQVVRSLILQQLQEKALLQVRQGTDELDQWLATRSSTIQTLANTNIVSSLNWQEIEPYLQSELKRINGFFIFGLTYPDGSFYTTESINTKKNNKDRDYIQKALAGQVNISAPFIGRTTGIPAIAIAAPISQADGSVNAPIGVLFGSLKVDLVSKVVSRLRYGNNSYAFALNSKGQAIIHPNPALMSTIEKPAPSFLESTDPGLAASARRMVSKEPGIELISIDGTNKYVAHIPLKQTDWSVALVIPRENIESQLGALNLLASILGGLLLIAAIVAWRQIQLSEQAKIQVTLLSQQQKTLQQQSHELVQTLQELQKTQSQLIQREKMSSLGQLVAGVAHEINNPVSFIYSNITPAYEYTQDLFRLLQLYQQYYPHPAPEIQNEVEAIELNFLMQDLPNLLDSMKVGADRIKDIVLSLRNFSRLDEADMKAVNIHEGIDSTLMILESRLKDTTKHPTITVTKEYNDLPLVECYAGELNQVFMNILVNAIDALENANESWFVGDGQDNSHDQLPTIFIYTKLTANQQVIIGIANNGPSIPETVQQRLFEPFFTTKPVGKGTGLGLSISYQIITEKHQGKLQCISSPGKGAEFVLVIPLKQQKQQTA
ncbi:signal transduction histidine kinase regulating C4-dicarboxylate transport system [Cylindrospermum stagnale PCC 7417]|uniref:histidine kinase n=1 Tax=Cylindrospermum stagnale PCC 7417 TaxID=56107 RepID=K9WWV8_9NOST|nr:cache domain-containing protein [Cylindrospermum stagnale]AFZ24683.1 signal transduction histidine kinase regulating C4-dicarboxylate transport system [Cylindrospermum stagnale PCC 7417]